MELTSWLLWIVGAYLLGSVPFGLLIGRLQGVDIRDHGSGNIGATNLWRTCGRRSGITCFVLDLGKGLVPTLGAGIAHGLVGDWMTAIDATQSWLWLSVAASALLGHVFPVYLGFKGGKGVATAFGVLLGVFPTLTAAAGVALVTWLVVMAVTRLVSIASMIAACMVPITTAVVLYLLPQPDTTDLAARTTPAMAIAILVAALVLVRHRSNVARLLKGDEHSVGKADGND